MSTLSSVPEETKSGSKLPEVRKKICEALGIYPEEIEHTLPVGIGKERIEKLEALINQQIKSVLDEALANSVFKHKHEAEEHVVDYKNGYNDGVEVAEDVIKEIRSRYE